MSTNVHKLVNIDSREFTETKDLAWVRPDSNFEMLGKMDISDVRGSNQLA